MKRLYLAKLKNTIELRRANGKIEADQYKKNLVLIKQKDQIIKLLDEILESEE